MNRALLLLALASATIACPLQPYVAAQDPKAGKKEGPPAGYAFDPRTLKPLTDGGLYLERFETGLYPGGRNEMPEPHQKAGERLAASIRPLDAKGDPDPKDGKILALAVGHSNGRHYFGALEEELRRRAEELHPRFEFVNAAVPGGGLLTMKNWEADPPRSKSWQKARELTSRPGYSALQVQVLFLIATAAPAHPKGKLSEPDFPRRSQEIRRDFGTVVARFARDYPNIKIAYLMSDGFRHHSGAEPHVYQEGFAVKRLIEGQINGEPGTAFEGEGRKLPWLAWGPYFWDNSWDPSYFLDGTHAAPKARAIFVEKCWRLLSQSPASKPWFLK